VIPQRLIADRSLDQVANVATLATARCTRPGGW
jgi:hypothetical protein